MEKFGTTLLLQVLIDATLWYNDWNLFFGLISNNFAYLSTDDEDAKKSDSTGQPTPTQSVSVETSDDIEIEIN